MQYHYVHYSMQDVIQYVVDVAILVSDIVLFNNSSKSFPVKIKSSTYT